MPSRPGWPASRPAPAHRRLLPYRGLPLPARLRHGHLMVAAALTAPGDRAVPPTRAHADALAALDAAAWGRLRLSAGWARRQAGGAPDGPQAADEEVRA